MATFVGQNPKPCEEQTLDKTVEDPERNGPRRLKTCQADGRVEQGADRHEVSCNVRKGSQKRAFEAFFWDGFSKSLDSGHRGISNRCHVRRGERLGCGCTHGGWWRKNVRETEKGRGRERARLSTQTTKLHSPKGPLVRSQQGKTKTLSGSHWTPMWSTVLRKVPR